MPNARVLKWRLEIRGDAQRFGMADGSKVLAVQIQDGWPTLWTLSPVPPPDTLYDVVERVFVLVPTGWSFDPEGVEYVGTVQLVNGDVLHLFEKLPR